MIVEGSWMIVEEGLATRTAARGQAYRLIGIGARRGPDLVAFAFIRTYAVKLCSILHAP
jgi:hypothetical protein